MSNGNLIKNFREKVLELKNKISDKDFFVSESCHAYLQNLAEAVTKQYNTSIALQLTWDDSPDVPTAYATDRSELHLNICNEYFLAEKERVGKLVILKALVLHECGHLLFTDSHLLKSSMKVFMQNRKLFPEPKCEEYKLWLTDAVCFSDEEMAEWLSLWKRIENSIEDGFIEGMILKTVPGDGQCLYPLRKIQKENFQSIKEQRLAGLDNPSILFNCILSLAKYNTVKMDPDDKDDEAVKELLNNYNLIQQAVNTQKSYDRVKLINTVFCKMYQYMKEDKEQKEQNPDDSSSENTDTNGENKNPDQDSDSSEQSGGSNTSSNGSPSSDSSSDQSNKTSGSDQKTQDLDGNPDEKGKVSPKNVLSSSQDTSINDNLDTNSGSVLNDNNIQPEEPDYASNNEDKLTQMQKEENTEAQIPSPEDMRETDSICESIAKDMANEELEKDLADALEEEARQFDYGKYNKNVSCSLVRREPSAQTKKIYDADMQDIGFLAKKMVNEIRNKIKDQQQGGKINGLYQGRYLDQHSLYRYDCRCLCRNDLPEDIPDMAIGILIDMSGSMSSESKYAYARRTALLLYEFGLKLHIPVMVYAHNDCGGVTNMYALADFASVDGKDRYRICDMTPSGCNRDGMALRFCSEKLTQRHEQNKFMFVISDGRPSAYDSRKDGDQDIKSVLMDYSKKNVRYIAIGLGRDQKEIEELYSSGLSPKVAAKFLQCENPAELPVTVIRTIKQLIKVK